MSDERAKTVWSRTGGFENCMGQSDEETRVCSFRAISTTFCPGRQLCSNESISRFTRVKPASCGWGEREIRSFLQSGVFQYVRAHADVLFNLLLCGDRANHVSLAKVLIALIICDGGACIHCLT